MKKVVLIIGCILYSYCLFGQSHKTYSSDTIHLSYNYFDEKNREKFKDPDYKNNITFKIYDERFAANCDNKNPIIVKDSVNLKKNIIRFIELVEKVNQINKYLRHKGKFIYGFSAFKQIYLYEKTKEGLIYRYAVRWYEVIECPAYTEDD